MNKQDFITKAKSVHGDKYDYALVKYTGSKQRVDIICPVHGTFSQIAANHLYGRGCAKCSKDKSGQAISSAYGNKWFKRA